MTFEQAASVVIRVLGYEKQAAERAPYPYGALLEAAYSGILDCKRQCGQQPHPRPGCADAVQCFFLMAGGGVLADRIIEQDLFRVSTALTRPTGPMKARGRALKGRETKAGETAVFKPRKIHGKRTWRLLQAAVLPRLP